MDHVLFPSDIDFIFVYLIPICFISIEFRYIIIRVVVNVSVISVSLDLVHFIHFWCG